MARVLSAVVLLAAISPAAANGYGGTCVYGYDLGCDPSGHMAGALAPAPLFPSLVTAAAPEAKAPAEEAWRQSQSKEYGAHAKAKAKPKIPTKKIIAGVVGGAAALGVVGLIAGAVVEGQKERQHPPPTPAPAPLPAGVVVESYPIPVEVGTASPPAAAVAAETAAPTSAPTSAPSSAFVRTPAPTVPALIEITTAAPVTNAPTAPPTAAPTEVFVGDHLEQVVPQVVSTAAPTEAATGNTPPPVTPAEILPIPAAPAPTTPAEILPIPAAPAPAAAAAPADAEVLVGDQVAEVEAPQRLYKKAEEKVTTPAAYVSSVWGPAFVCFGLISMFVLFSALAAYRRKQTRNVKLAPQAFASFGDEEMMCSGTHGDIDQIDLIDEEPLLS